MTLADGTLARAAVPSGASTGMPHVSQLQNLSNLVFSIFIIY